MVAADTLCAHTVLSAALLLNPHRDPGAGAVVCTLELGNLKPKGWAGSHGSSGPELEARA